MNSMLPFLIWASVFSGAQATDEVSLLREQYESKRKLAIESATKSIDEVYITKLEEILERRTKAGRLEEALAIEAMLREKALLQQLPGEWRWGDSGDRILTVFDDKSASLTGEENQAAWLPLGPRKIQLFFAHASFVLEFDDTMKTGTAVRRDGIKASLRRVD